MTVLMLDGSSIENLSQLHTAFMRAFSFPEWYGKNFDALFDCLTDMEEEAVIRVTEQTQLWEHLGMDAVNTLRHVLADAAAENPNLKIEYME